MANDLVKAQPATPVRWTRAQVDLLKRTLCKGLDDDEMQLFIYVSKRTGLDPFMRQIYAHKMWDSQLGDYKVVFVTGIDGFRLQSARAEGYAGVDPPEFEVDQETGLPLKARVTVWRFVDGEKCAFVGEARFKEFARYGKDGQLFRQWKESPFNQLAKCAEAQAHRKASPAEVQGLLIHEDVQPLGEMGPSPDAGTFIAGKVYEGTITSFRLPDTKAKRPGQVALEVEGVGTLGPIGYWETPAALKDAKPDKAVGLRAQVSYEEKKVKGVTYKNVSHFAVAEEQTEIPPPSDVDVLVKEIVSAFQGAGTLTDLDGAWAKHHTEIKGLAADTQEKMRMAYLDRKNILSGPQGKML